MAVYGPFMGIRKLSVRNVESFMNVIAFFFVFFCFLKHRKNHASRYPRRCCGQLAPQRELPTTERSVGACTAVAWHMRVGDIPKEPFLAFELSTTHLRY